MQITNSECFSNQNQHLQNQVYVGIFWVVSKSYFSKNSILEWCTMHLFQKVYKSSSNFLVTLKCSWCLRSLFLILIGWCGVVLTCYFLFLVGGVTITYQITSGGTLQTNGTLTLCDALDDGTSEIFGLLNFITLN